MKVGSCRCSRQAVIKKSINVVVVIVGVPWSTDFDWNFFRLLERDVCSRDPGIGRLLDLGVGGAKG